MSYPWPAKALLASSRDSALRLRKRMRIARSLPSLCEVARGGASIRCTAIDSGCGRILVDVSFLDSMDYAPMLGSSCSAYSRAQLPDHGEPAANQRGVADE